MKFSETEEGKDLLRVLGMNVQKENCDSDRDKDNWPQKNNCVNWVEIEDGFYSYCRCDYVKEIIRAIDLVFEQGRKTGREENVYARRNAVIGMKKT